jgi:hypothetical protein
VARPRDADEKFERSTFNLQLRGRLLLDTGQAIFIGENMPVLRPKRSRSTPSH